MRFPALPVYLVAFAVFACGGDGDDDGGRSDASAARSGSGTRRGAWDASSVAEAAGTAPICSRSRTCHNERCSTAVLDASAAMDFAANGGYTLCVEPCCTEDNKCGSRLKITYYVPQTGNVILSTPICIEQNQPGTQSASCSGLFDTMLAEFEDAGTGSFSTALAGLELFNYEGCCRPDGYCGYVIPHMGSGCASKADTRDIISLLNLIETTDNTCDP